MAIAHLACCLKGRETRGQLMETKHVCGLEPLCLRGFRSAVGSWTMGSAFQGTQTERSPRGGGAQPHTQRCARLTGRMNLALLTVIKGPTGPIRGSSWVQELPLLPPGAVLEGSPTPRVPALIYCLWELGGPCHCSYCPSLPLPICLSVLLSKTSPVALLQGGGCWSSPT